MFENLRAANDDVENPEGREWREIKEQAPAAVEGLLKEKGLPLSMEGVSLEEAHATSDQVRTLIENVSHDDEGNVNNKERYVARELGVYSNYIDKYVSFQEAPRPSFMEKEAANDNRGLIADAN